MAGRGLVLLRRRIQSGRQAIVFFARVCSEVRALERLAGCVCGARGFVELRKCHESYMRSLHFARFYTFHSAKWRASSAFRAFPEASRSARC